MDFPVIQSASLNGTTLTLAGYIGTAAGDTDFAGARVEFFKSPDAAGANGEGQVYLGFLTANASGNFSGTLTVSGLALGERVSATATDTSNSTSEFGVNVSVVGAAPVATNDAYSVNEDSSLTIPRRANWWNTSWSQRKQLTFNNTGQAENLVNFAVLVEIDNTPHQLRAHAERRPGSALRGRQRDVARARDRNAGTRAVRPMSG